MSSAGKKSSTSPTPSVVDRFSVEEKQDAKLSIFTCSDGHDLLGTSNAIMTQNPTLSIIANESLGRADGNRWVENIMQIKKYLPPRDDRYR